jgi:hypothetical protein
MWRHMTEECDGATSSSRADTTWHGLSSSMGSKWPGGRGAAAITLLTLSSLFPSGMMILRCGGLRRRGMAMLTAPEIDALLKKATAIRDKAATRASPQKKHTAKVPIHQQRVDALKESQQVPKAAQRCQDVAVLGAPNAGKSTLLNKMLGSKALASLLLFHTGSARGMQGFLRRQVVVVTGS